MESDELIEHSHLIEQLRDNLQLSIEENSDESILYWLKAENFDLKNTEENFVMLKNFEKIAYPGNNDPIFKKERKRIKEKLAKYAPLTYIGFDKDDFPILIYSFKDYDYTGTVKSFTMYDLVAIRYFLYYKMKRAHYERNKELGINKEYLCTYLLDIEHFRFETLATKYVVDFFLNLVNIFQTIYPGTLSKCIIINAPFLIHTFFPLFKAIMRKDIVEKIKIFDKESTPEELLEIFDVDVLPKFLGGTRVDANGDPLCEAFMKYGCKIPGDLYVANIAPLPLSDSKVKELVVPAKTFEDVPIIIKESGAKIHVQFRSSDSINFQVFFQKSSETNSKFKNGEIEEKIFSPSFGIMGHITPMNNFFYCSDIGTYILRFDNTASWITEIRIFYKIEVINSS